MISSLIILPAAGAFFLLFLESHRFIFIRNIALFWSLSVFNFSVFLLFFFDPFSCQFQLIENFSWFTFFNNSVLLGLDGLSLYMVLLTTFLTPVCILLSWNLKIKEQTKSYLVSFLFLESILLGVFCSLDLLLFYILFEAVLIPMYFVVGLFGSRERKVRASYLLFTYTLVSSILMFVSILFIYFKSGSTCFLDLQAVRFTPFVEKLCWLGFFSSFAVKMPLVPFHIWLPEAHCEAPTAGSVILAGVLLKLGGFGFLRYSVGLFPETSAFFAPLVYALSCLGVIYASLFDTFQENFKDPQS